MAYLALVTSCPQCGDTTVIRSVAVSDLAILVLTVHCTRCDLDLKRTEDALSLAADAALLAVNPRALHNN